MRGISGPPRCCSWVLELLGNPRAVCPEGKVYPLARRAGILLAYLAVEGPTPRAALAALLWPDRPEREARNNLRQLLHRMGPLRQLLAGSDPLGLAPAVRVPALGLAGRGAASDALQGLPEGPLEFLPGADARAGDVLLEWVQDCRERVRGRVAAALEAQALAAEASGDLRAALRLAGRLLELDALSEWRLRLLMRLHAANGDRAAALSAYESFRFRLRDRLDLSPSPETEALAQALRDGEPHACLYVVRALPRSGGGTVWRVSGPEGTRQFASPHGLAAFLSRAAAVVTSA